MNCDISVQGVGRTIGLRPLVLAGSGAVLTAAYAVRQSRARTSGTVHRKAVLLLL